MTCTDATRLRWLSTAIAAGVLLVFLNCLPNSFVWDDEQFIVKNRLLTSAALLPQLLTQNIVAGAGLVSNLYRPVQSLTHFLDVQLWGYQPWGHHLTTVLIHVAASVAVFRLLARLLAPWPAAFAAAFFALHPLQSEAVAYTCGRGDGLAVLFLCLGLLAFRRHPWWAALWALLGMGSKESAALFPILLLLYDRADGRPASWRRHLPFWGLAGMYAAARLTVLNFKDTLNFYDAPNVLTEQVTARLYTYLTTLPKGLLLWCWPTDLHHERSWSVFTTLGTPQVWGSLLLVIALLGGSWWLRNRARIAATGLWWFFLATIPTSNLFVLINALFYDHWFLLPGLGLAMVVGQGLSWAYGQGRDVRRPAMALSVAALLACAGLTIRYNRIWRDPLTLNQYLLSQEPGSAKLHNNLAMAYAEVGLLREAIPMYHRAIELSDEFPQTHHNLANAYLRLGETRLALAAAQQAVAMDRSFHHSWLTIGAIQLQQRRLQAAAEAFARARDAYPYDPHAYLGLAQVRVAQGRLPDARAALEAGVAVLPDDVALTTALQQLTWETR